MLLHDPGDATQKSMNNNHKNYYQILHVQADAPTEVIRSSYRTMMQKLKMHPDLGGDQEMAALVNEAYAVLTNPVARAKYDASFKADQDSTKPEQATATTSNTNSPKNAVVKPRVIDIAKCCPFCQTAHQFGRNLQPHHTCSSCDSTLFPAIKQNFEDRDQRIIQRIDKQWPVSFYINWPSSKSYDGQTQDVSLNGLQILTGTELQEGQIVKITSGTLDAIARVVNHRECRIGLRRKWRVGLEFLTLRFHQTHGTFIRTNA